MKLVEGPSGQAFWNESLIIDLPTHPKKDEARRLVQFKPIAGHPPVQLADARHHDRVAGDTQVRRSVMR